MKCCLCHKEIDIKGTWKRGNNAEPIKTGRCCDKCNQNQIIPARIVNAQTIKGGIN